LFSLLFLCTGNSARSQLAEALFRHLADDSFRVFSAGTQPQGIDERVYQVLDSLGIPSTGLTSQSIEDLKVDHFDCVITLCDNAKNECAHYPDSEALIHWDLEDPKGELGIAPFEKTAEKLQEHILLFLKLNRPGVIHKGTDPADFFKILSDTTRLRILMLIEDEQELCVSDLTEALQESQPKISRHLAQMRSLKILKIRRQAQQIFYRLSDELPDWMKLVLATTRNGQPNVINQEKIRLKAHSTRSSHTPC
jgi:arsenate reductase